MTPLEALLGHTLNLAGQHLGPLGRDVSVRGPDHRFGAEVPLGVPVSGAMIAWSSPWPANLGVIPTRSVLYDDIVLGFFVTPWASRF